MNTATENATRTRSVIMKLPGGPFTYRHAGSAPVWNASLVSGASSAFFWSGTAIGGEYCPSWWRRCPSGSPTTSFSRIDS
jgi:hypothetical protein